VSTGSDAPQAPADVVAWHDVECGAYTADLSVWEALAAETSGPIVELGSGTGRVALHLARAGHPVIAVERDAALAAELERSAEAEGSELTVLAADLRDLEPGSLEPAPGLAIAPMHVIQTFDASGRREIVEAMARLLAPGGALALVVIEETHSGELASGDLMLLPDVREIDGWVYSSQPLWVQLTDETITARRLRERVAPDGELSRSVHDDVLYRTPAVELERMGAELGLRVAERRPISSGPGESDSIAVILETP
jgi:SAM-dependent methyltransferase